MKVGTLAPSSRLLTKIGSLIIHYQEWTATGHAFDKRAIDTLEKDEEVKEWLEQMNNMALLPVKR